MKEKLKSYSFIILIAVIASIPLFSNDYRIYNDDGIQHICRLIGTYQSITEGQTFPVIMSNFCNGFGYSWNLFYSPITAYIPLLFHFITNSFVLDMKFFMILASILSGITMYELMQDVTKNKYASLLASAIYILAPYRLTDMYIRMAFSEFTSFIFLPMVFHGLYSIFNTEELDKKKPEILLITGAIGLILTHLVMTMYVAIFSFIYIIINIKKLKEKKILKKLFISFIFIICVTSFFLLPMLEQKLNSNYEVFREGRMVITDILIKNKLDIIDFIYTEKGKMVFEIGLVTITGIILTIFAYKKIDKNYRKFYIVSLVMGIASLLMSTKIFPFEKLPATLKMLQFSFRMLEFSSFFLAIVASINLWIMIKDFKMKDVIVLTGIMILLLVPMSIRNIPYSDKILDEKSLLPGIPVTQERGGVHVGCATFEYLPSKAFEHLDYIKTRENKTYLLEGKGNIVYEQKDRTNMVLKIENVEADTTFELPYIYYKGYEAVLNTDIGKEKLMISESQNGFIQIKLDKNIKKGEIIVSYSGTNVMKVSMIISILSFSILILYACWKKKQNI